MSFSDRSIARGRLLLKIGCGGPRQVVELRRLLDLLPDDAILDVQNDFEYGPIMYVYLTEETA